MNEAWQSGISLDTFYADGSVLVLCAALLAHLLIPIPRELHPTTLWRKFAHLLANKVNQGNDPNYQRFAGSLSWLMLMLPATALLIAVSNLVWEPLVFQFTLLFFSLGWREQEVFARQSGQALAQEDKASLRKSLSHCLNRDCATLSLLGLGKACVETLTLGHLRNVTGVLFWFAVAGPIGAALFRLCGEIARAWPAHYRQYKTFGQLARTFYALLEWLPSSLFSLLLLLNQQSLSCLSTIVSQAKTWRNKSSGTALASLGNQYQLSLGGPALYQGQKLERAKLGGKIAPSAIHLSQVATKLRNSQYLFIVLLLITLALANGGI
ncbi:hypothetical protein ST37_19250 [Vibrio sp. qd031]|uniref:cobalamin biosynthesis family protein n=1 Tax=Vibrio sp. qd031 TaxID=1603038 RepID=UPI000A0FB47C|nr:cobalamin biosynthesis family protein [Vibrio sp. qd031]ORT48341.1 hypothetical protein ST37_19250 [Vibrio sp. qd031]